MLIELEYPHAHERTAPGMQTGLTGYALRSISWTNQTSFGDGFLAKTPKRTSGTQMTSQAYPPAVPGKSLDFAREVLLEREGKPLQGSAFE
jgi:hypothetical protein